MLILYIDIILKIWSINTERKLDLSGILDVGVQAITISGSNLSSKSGSEPFQFPIRIRIWLDPNSQPCTRPLHRGEYFRQTRLFTSIN